ncbi:putative cullin [Medicago truncatula]|uniref:Putative cullin n=1 Tax=Medicago truncatula TaxID=3880 RepID=A0A396GYC8_MEDTR|nr:putative cullin [Medicago truncatula]
MSNPRKRNFRIEGFKHGVVMDPQYGDKTWIILENAIHQIYNHNASGLSFEELYRNAYNMVLHKFGERLDSGLVATVTSHLQEMARSVEATQGSSFLVELNRMWEDHNKALQMIRDILMYMDRTYIQTIKKTTVYELGLNLWRENVLHSNQIRTRLLNMLLELVHSERAGEVVNRGLIRSITKMLIDTGPSVYVEEFENPFLLASTEFYRAESQIFIECCGSGDYLKKAEMHLNEELDRVSHYLDPSTETKITTLVEKEMLENHMLRLIYKETSGLVNMLGDDKYEDLGRMYNLFSRVTDGLLKIREVMTS